MVKGRKMNNANNVVLKGEQRDPKNRKSHLMHINIQSVRGKIDELLFHVNSLKQQIDILCLSEHWLSHENSCVLNKLTPFKPISVFGRSNKIRGGVCIAARDGVAAARRQDI